MLLSPHFPIPCFFSGLKVTTIYSFTIYLKFTTIFYFYNGNPGNRLKRVTQNRAWELKHSPVDFFFCPVLKIITAFSEIRVIKQAEHCKTVKSIKCTFFLTLLRHFIKTQHVCHASNNTWCVDIMLNYSYFSLCLQNNIYKSSHKQ